MTFYLGEGTYAQEIASVSTTLAITPGNGHLVVNATLEPGTNNAHSLGTSTSLWAEAHINVGNFGQVNVDNLRLDGNTLSSTDTNGNVIIDANGTGQLVLSDTTRPAVDNTTDMGASSFRFATTYTTNLDATGTATLATVDINGGTIDGTTIGGTTPAVGSFTQVNVDNLRLDGNTISSTDVNGNVILDANGTGNIVASDTFRPNTDDSTDLGTSTLRFRHEYISASVRVGDSHTLSTADRVLVTGANNVITGASNNAVALGRLHTLTGSAEAALLGGNTSTISASADAAVVGGALHQIRSSADSGLVAGNTNSIRSTSRAFIGGGINNSITATSTNSAIVAGSANVVTASLRSVAIGGQTNSITASSSSAIIGGSNGTISSANQSVVLKGSTTTRTYSTANYIHLDAPNNQFYGHAIPHATNTHTAGTSSLRWATVYGVNFDATGTATLATVDINGGTIDGTTIGGSAAAGATFTIVQVDNLRLDGNTLSATNVNGNVNISANGAGDIIMNAITRPSVDDTSDFGTSSFRWQDGFFSSSVRVGDTLTVTSSDRVMISGETNAISSSNNGFITGLSNTLSSCTEGAVVGGTGSAVSGGQRSAAVGGTGLRVTNCNHSVAVGGNGNILTNSASNSVIVGGQTNTMNTASRAAIIAGFQNSMTGTCTHSVLIGGQNGALSGASEAVVLKTGSTSRTYSTSNQIYLDSVTISSYGSIVPNADNTLNVGTNSLRFNQLHLGDGFEVSDGGNTVSSNCSEYGLIGSFHTMTNGCQYVFNTGVSNSMNNSLYGAIIGDDNSMQTTVDGGIFGSNGCRVTSSSQACIFGGTNNSITGSADTGTIIGGRNVTLTALVANTTVIKGDDTARTITGRGIHLDGQSTCYGDVKPNTTNTRTLGSTTLEWADVRTVNINSSGTSTLATVDINGGAIDGTTIGGTVAAVGSFTQVNVDNLRLDGNTLSSTNTNGDITFDANGTGNIVCNDVIRPSADDTTGLGTTTQRWTNIHASTSVRVGDTFTIGSGPDRYILVGASHNIANNNSNSIIVGSACTLNGNGNNMIVGSSHRLVGSTASVIVGGNGSSITNTSTNAGIFAGSGHIINGSLRACMLSGANNSITGSSTDSVIIGGANGTISSITRAIVLKTNGTVRTYTTSEVHLDGPTQCYGNVYPNATNTYTLGTSSLRWSTVYGVNFDGTGTATFATVDINGGAIDGTTIGGTTPAVGTFTQVNVDNLRLDGNTLSSTNTNGDITFDANGTGNIICSDTLRPSADATTDFGSSSVRWLNGYFSNSLRVGNINSAAGARVLATGSGVTVSAADCAVVGGTGNSVVTTQSVICGGLTNAISSARAFIGGGQLNSVINTSTQSAILGGFTNTINGSLRAAIVGGNSNSITNSSTHSVIVGGTSGTISGATAAVVLKGGTTSRTYSTANQIYLDSSTISCYGDVLPDTDGVNDLGSASLQWFDIFSVNTVTVSDERLKENVTPLEPGLDVVKQLQPVSFDWKNTNMNLLNKKQYGFIAQQVEAVEPALVRKPTDRELKPDLAEDKLQDKLKEREDDIRGLNYNAFIPILVNSIKELATKCDTLQATVQSQAATIQQLQADIALLKGL